MFHGLHGLYFDPTMILIIPAIILSMWAQSKVSNTFNKYSSVPAAKGYTGADVARQLLNIAGITDVTVEHISGSLTDHYDPKNKVLRLSDPVFNSKSIAAIGVAAHETGHAIQHDKDYFPLSIRTAIFPIVNISSKLAMPLIMLGLVFGFFGSFSNIILNIGIILFSAVVFFQLVTLPVEFNASSRAISLLENYGFLTNSEIPSAKKVLSAAAMTYVAAAASGILNLLRLLIISGRRRN